MSLHIEDEFPGIDLFFKRIFLNAYESVKGADTKMALPTPFLNKDRTPFVYATNFLMDEETAKTVADELNGDPQLESTAVNAVLAKESENQKLADTKNKYCLTIARNGLYMVFKSLSGKDQWEYIQEAKKSGKYP